MLLQQIVETLDAELAKLLQIREVVSALGSAPLHDVMHEPVTVHATDQKALVSLSASEPVSVQRLPPSRRGQKRQRTGRRKTEAVAMTALASRVPTGPIVMSADALAREKAMRAQRTPAETPKQTPEKGSLGAMIKAMQLRTAV